jgi:hypothetical protein
MLHALDLTRSVQTAKTPWQAISKNDNETIECVPRGSARIAFQDTLAALPIVTYEAGETVIADGSRTGRLLILMNGTVTILKDDKEIPKVAEPGAVFGELSSCWISHTPPRCVPWKLRSFTSPTRPRCSHKIPPQCSMLLPFWHNDSTSQITLSFN